MSQGPEQMSLAEYLAMEPVEGVKYEWINGEAYAMAGGRPIHSAVTFDVGVALAAQLRGGPCRPSSSDLRLHVALTQAYFYPDLMVMCPPWETVDGDVQSVTNPALIVEVLSPSTAVYDRGAKWEHYRRIPSLQDCLFIDTEARSITHFARTTEGWSLRDVTEGGLTLAHLGIELSIQDVFGDLEHVPNL